MKSITPNLYPIGTKITVDRSHMRNNKITYFIIEDIMDAWGSVGYVIKWESQRRDLWQHSEIEKLGKILKVERKSK